MPKSDFTKWSKPVQIGQLIKGWVDGLNVPNNDSFALLKVKNEHFALEFFDKIITKIIFCFCF